MTEIFYYEKIAAELMGIQPESIFEKRGKEEIVFARNLCVYYRRNVLKLFAGICVTRYNLDHSMTTYIIKTMDNYIETKDERGQIIKRFMNMCNSVTKDLVDIADAKLKVIVKEKINSIGTERYIDEVGRCLYTLMNVLIYESDRKLELRKKCIGDALVKLKELNAYYA